MNSERMQQNRSIYTQGDWSLVIIELASRNWHTVYRTPDSCDDLYFYAKIAYLDKSFNLILSFPQVAQ
jgi:hypothetical protein